MIIVALIAIPANAQVSHGGEPYSWSDKSSELNPSHPISMPTLNLEELRAEDEVTDQFKETPYRFGVERDVNIDLLEAAQSENIGGMILHKMSIYCPEATSVNVIFSAFDVPKGDKVYLYDAARENFLGGFDHRNQNSEGGLAISLLPTDHLVIEYQQNGSGVADLQIAQVIHGYRPVLNKWEDPERGPYGNSGACNINVNCPEGADWQDDKKSVALIISGGFASCTGALVNNTAQDGTPYFLTANHCLGGSVSNWVFLFNHESSGCSGDNGPTSDTVSGSELRASNGGSDFALLELDEEPPSSYDVQFSGWDRSDLENVTNTVGIHHPSGDVKKICFDEDDAYHDNINGAAVWWIDEWEDGVTEGGSSGSPLFDQNHRIIGQLYGGAAACNGSTNNGAFDYYGRFGVSWDGNSPSSRLRDWLDPLGTNPLVLDGFPYGASSFALDATVAPQNNDLGTVCSSVIDIEINIINQGTTTMNNANIGYTINGSSNSIEWTGNLEQFESESVTLPAIALVDGMNELIVTVSSPNDNSDQNDDNNSFTQQFMAVTGESLEYSFDLTLDNYGSETTWEIVEGGNALYSGGPYSDFTNGELISEDFCLSVGCYEFVIYDDFGDGLCCDFGEGGYMLSDNEGETVTEGATFESEESAEFCVEINSTSVKESISSVFNLYPNPNNGSFVIEKGNDSSVDQIAVLDATGRILLQKNFGNVDRLVIEERSLSPGIYFVKDRSGELNGAIRLVIQ